MRVIASASSPLPYPPPMTGSHTLTEGRRMTGSALTALDVPCVVASRREDIGWGSGEGRQSGSSLKGGWRMTGSALTRWTLYKCCFSERRYRGGVPGRGSNGVSRWPGAGGFMLEAFSAPRRPKTAPRRPRSPPRRPPDGPRRPQDALRPPQEAPRGRQEAPKTPQERPRRPQEAPRRFPDGILGLFLASFWTPRDLVN